MGCSAARGSRPATSSPAPIVEKQTPYNTYAVEGLPPGPIANAGRASLEAVANPSRTRDLFFVADGSGGHVFAETYEEHLRNVARWRDINAASAPSPTDQPADAAAGDAGGDAAAGDQPLALTPPDQPAQ